MKQGFLRAVPATLLITMLLVSMGSVTGQQAIAQKQPAGGIPLDSFEMFFGTGSRSEVSRTLEKIDAQWHDAYYAPLIEILSLSGNRGAGPQIRDFLDNRAEPGIHRSAQAWFQWLWNRPPALAPDYAAFKASIYRPVDSRFARYFEGRQDTAQIRLDEIRWGGVRQDGIPPLRQPRMIAAADADYLDDDNVVFGITINGDARAYPKRVLAWHEMFVDTVGGVEIAGVYCTLCGALIPYRTRVNGVNHELGTSGFLYRSNKLMYDKATQSLWSTMRGEPVVGPLVGQGITLAFEPAITTTWGEWRRRHPDSLVLSLDTGHERDYGEGVAYKNYFATDDLMFNTPFNDDRLANKREVLGLRFPGAPDDQVAIDSDFLARTPLFSVEVGFQNVVVLTDSSGANRVYDPKSVVFSTYDGDRTLTDNADVTWQLSENELRAADGRRLPRLPAHRAFWFGWHAAFPETRLIR